MTQPPPNAPLDIEVASDVIPIYAGKKDDTPPSLLKLSYDLLMLVLILVDLALIFFDQIMMSAFFGRVVEWTNLSDWLTFYQTTPHQVISTVGGFFTIFLIVELLVRWGRAIAKKTYYRWFFFPFVHWYEVLGCFPLLRPLRLLRAVVLIKRLHELGINVIPEKWIKTARFYAHIALEELSDRVILTAIGNFKEQLKRSTTHQSLIQATIDKNRDDVERVLLQMLRKELLPKLTNLLVSETNVALSKGVGQAVETALQNSPELHKMLRLIPIAGGMIESQMTVIGRRVGENVTESVNAHLLSEQVLDKLMQEIAKGVASIDTTSPDLQKMVATVVDDAMSAFEAQVKVQQWKHTQYISL